MNGKGSKQRPTDTKKYNDNYDSIFIKSKKKKKEIWQQLDLFYDNHKKEEEPSVPKDYREVQSSMTDLNWD